ncbi:MAG: peptide ABC transporter substrate-binding protein, partial [Chloroflexota bacterium]
AWPVREDIVTRFGDRWTEPPNYIGNGPFILTNWAHQERMEFAPNPYYHGQQPAIAKLVFVQAADANQAFFAYQNGELDAVAVPDANVRLVLQDPALKGQVVRFNELTAFGFQFNVKNPPLDHVKVRQAIAMAVDREALVEKVAQGVGRVAYSVVPPGMPGHEEQLGRDFAFNPARAKALLGEAGYQDPAQFPVLVNSFFDNSTNRARAEFFQAQMKQNLAIQVTLEPLDAKTFQQRFNAGQFTVAFSGWGADYPDPDNFVPELFASDSGNNHTGYARAEVDRLIEACRRELVEERRRDACSRAQKMVVEDQPWVFAFYRESLWLLKPYVKGFQPTAKDHLPGSRYYDHLSIVR